MNLHQPALYQWICFHIQPQYLWICFQIQANTLVNQHIIRGSASTSTLSVDVSISRLTHFNQHSICESAPTTTISMDLCQPPLYPWIINQHSISASVSTYRQFWKFTSAPRTTWPKLGISKDHGKSKMPVLCWPNHPLNASWPVQTQPGIPSTCKHINKRVIYFFMYVNKRVLYFLCKQKGHLFV